MTAEPLGRLAQALPLFRAWVADLLTAHRSTALAVNAFGFSRLPQYFPDEVLRRVRVVKARRVPFPPVSAMGLPELSAMERMPMAGITFGSTIFVTETMCSESTCFHEVVHVVQWDTLGIDGFLLAYGGSLLRYGYDDNLFEVLAYRLQRVFDRGAAIPGITGIIEAHSRAVRASVAPEWGSGFGRTAGT